ncbi:MAG TPA: thymidine phosphorylase [Candidatus Dojkabacteria bacterium]|nr:thymidine phosphorylase [Candidatus Dojkabacteria bacterium]
MSIYLTSKNIDLGEDDDFNVIIHRKDAERIGVKEGEIVFIGFGEIELYADVIETETKVQEGQIGLFEEIWKAYKIPDGSSIFADIPEPSRSLEAISKKLLGQPLSKEELESIMKDIGSRKLRETEIAFFVSTFFNPGFNDEEIYWMTKGMAESGDSMNFKNIRQGEEVVADKHSIGGVAGKAITPTLIPILVSGGLIVPNTSTRAITSPAGTTDILEVVMPVALSKEKVYEVVKKTGGCMFWGGALELSPADDVIINVERSLRIQEFQKVLVSIVAKKVSMGISHILIDLPYGKGSKVENVDDVSMLDKEFRKLFRKFGIKCETIKRLIKGPDGRSIGPNAEIRQALKILERDKDRCIELEKVILDMAGMIFEMTGKVQKGQGKKFALNILNDKRALRKFWEIAFAQGATKEIHSSEIKDGELKADLLSDRSGKVVRIDNTALVSIARALGNPQVKEAGIFVHKMPGEMVKKGDKLITIYASTEARLASGKGLFNINKLYKIK